MNGPLVWRALLAGAGFNVALSLLMSFGSGFLFGIVDPSHYLTLAFVLRVVSALTDIGGGAIGGFIARRDGPLHGVLTSLIATVVMLPISMLRMWLITRSGNELQLDARYWIDFGLWFGVGLLLAGFAGFLAVELRKPGTR